MREQKDRKIKVKKIKHIFASLAILLLPIIGISGYSIFRAADAFATGCDGYPSALFNAPIVDENVGQYIGVNPAHDQNALHYGISTDTLTICYRTDGTRYNGGFGIAVIRDNACYNYYGSGCWLEPNYNYDNIMTSSGATPGTEEIVDFQCETNVDGSGWFDINKTYTGNYIEANSNFDGFTNVEESDSSTGGSLFYQTTGSNFCT